MQFDFPTILFLATLVTGGIWAVDAFFFAPRRSAAAMDAGADEHKSGHDQARVAKEPLIVEYSRSFFPVILVVLLLRSFLLEPFRIPSGSMMPTLLAGDFILVNKYAYGIRLPVINRKIFEIDSPSHGDVVVFRYPKDPSTDYIKRVIGLPGDHIEYKDKMLYINGKRLEYRKVGEYIGTGDAASMTGARVSAENFGDVEHEILTDPRSFHYAYACMRNNQIVVPEGQYFVMGDNRDHSNDSRFWCTVPDENLVGKAFMIWMNWGLWDRIGNSIK